MRVAAVALTPVESRPAERSNAASAFNDHVAALLDRIDCRVAETPGEREAIFRLRYDAYIREGTIASDPSEAFSDSYDDSENAHVFGLYLDGELASSIRIHVASAAYPDFPSHKVFADVLEPELQAGRVLIDYTRFVTSKTLSQLNPALPYATLRLGWMAGEHFRAQLLLAAVRIEHQAFYRRTFGHRPICPPRTYPLLAKQISLMAADREAVTDRVYRRYPFFRSTFFERRMLFDRQLRMPAAFMARQATVVPMDAYRPAQ
jgi:N-acyl-L-homoserine lactone synthetase